MTAFRVLRRLALLGAGVLFVACSTEGITVPPEVPLETQAWAPALQVNLAQFTKLTSGVYYLDSLEGTGAVLTGTPGVSVFYSGFLPNGTKFDERASTATPICFPLSGLIEGWKVGMQGMKVGGKRRLLIPSGYGYGPAANGPIPANSNLLFNITLVATGCTP